jgi:hypothetical protein
MTNQIKRICPPYKLLPATWQILGHEINAALDHCQHLCEMQWPIRFRWTRKQRFRTRKAALKEYARRIHLSTEYIITTNLSPEQEHENGMPGKVLWVLSLPHTWGSPSFVAHLVLYLEQSAFTITKTEHRCISQGALNYCLLSNRKERWHWLIEEADSRESGKPVYTTSDSFFKS